LKGENCFVETPKNKNYCIIFITNRSEPKRASSSARNVNEDCDSKVIEVETLFYDLFTSPNNVKRSHTKQASKSPEKIRVMFANCVSSSLLPCRMPAYEISHFKGNNAQQQHQHQRE